MISASVKNIIIGIIALNFVVIFHEFGHFAACKLFGVPVHTFSIGFPPVLASVKLGATNYQLGALPLGGYVAPDEKAVQELPYIKKMIMVLAGIFMNFLLSFLILFGLARAGTETPTPVIGEVTPDSPASNAGLHAGDRFIAVNGSPIDPENVLSFLQELMTSPGKQVTLTIERHGKEMDIPLTIGKNHPLYGQGVGRIGTQLVTKQAARPSLWQAVTHTRQAFTGLMSSMGPTVTALLKPKNKNGSGIVGPIGIMSVLGKSLGYGYKTFLYFIALISFNIGAFNLLPIPMLDGGTAARFTLEALTGSHLPPFISTVLYLLVIAIMTFIMIRLTVGDVRRLFQK